MKHAVVICGRIGSGKSTAVAYLAENFDFKVVSFGRYIKDFAGIHGVPGHRDMLQDIGAYLFRANGASGLLRDALQHFGINNEDSVIFDGVRHPEVLAEIRRNAETTTAVYLDVSNEERSRRHQSREGPGLSLRDHLTADAHIVESNICRIIYDCDLVVDAMRPKTDIKTELKDLISRRASA